MFFCIQTLASLSRLLHELNQHKEIEQTENKVVQANTKTHKMQYSAELFRLSFLMYTCVQLACCEGCDDCGPSWVFSSCSTILLFLTSSSVLSLRHSSSSGTVLRFSSKYFFFHVPRSAAVDVVRL